MRIWQKSFMTLRKIIRMSTTRSVRRSRNFVSNDQYAVKVEMSNGEVKEFDLLGAADGQWSRIRKQSFPSESVQVLDLGMDIVY